MHRAFSIWFFFALTACTELRAFVFEKTGIPMQLGVSSASLKELHLSGLIAPDRYLLAKGNVVEAGEGGTFIVIEDGQAKVMVDVTAINPGILKGVIGKRVEIVGRFSGGKKGLPLLVASALRDER